MNKILLYRSLQNAVILPYYKALQQRYREILSVKTDLSLSGVTLDKQMKKAQETDDYVLLALSAAARVFTDYKE